MMTRLWCAVRRHTMCAHGLLCTQEALAGLAAGSSVPQGGGRTVALRFLNFYIAIAVVFSVVGQVGRSMLHGARWDTHAHACRAQPFSCSA